MTDQPAAASFRRIAPAGETVKPAPAATLADGLALHRAGRLGAAEAIYTAILRERPMHAQALALLGTIAYQRGDAEQAVRLIARSLEIDPSQDRALVNRGVALAALARHEEALAHFDRAIALKRGYAEAYNLRGNALRDLGQYEEALASIETAIVLKPGYPEAYNNRGNVLADLGRHDEALVSYDEAIALKADYAEAFNNRGLALRDAEAPGAAIADFDRAIALKPNYAEAWNNRGIALGWDLGRHEEALANYDRAIALKPDYAPAWNHRGMALKALKRHREAVANFDQSIALKPDLASAYWNKSVAMLLRGEFSEGWDLYEWRWKRPDLPPPRDFPQPLWLGREDVAGKTVLLHAEQGFGDTLQFCRYAPLLAARRATVALEIQPALKSLAASLDGVGPVICQGEPLPDFDLHCPLLSLPLAFGTTLATIPGRVPYLTARPAQVAAWRNRLGDLAGLRVGLVWAGDPLKHQLGAAKIDRRRSISLDHFAMLAGVPGISFVSLQKGEAAAQTRSPPRRIAMHDWTDELDDFADTAALIEALDLVISVDTAVAHLAGALGKPVWLLNRFDTCWRWLLDRADSPWYPTLRQFRQPSQGDWETVLANVRLALLEMVAGSASAGG